MLRLLPILLIFALSPPAIAQDAEQTKAFNEAWFAYSEARDAGSAKRMMETASTVYEIARELFPADDERLPLLMEHYGQALLLNGESERARDMFKEALEQTREIHGEQSTEVLPILMNYADSEASFQRSGRQRKLYKEALEIAEAAYGSRSAEYASVAFRAGVRVLERSSSNEGLKYLEEAYEIYSELEGAGSQSAGLAAFYAGKVEFGKRNFKRATDYFLAALQGLEGDIEYEGFARAYLVQVYEHRGMSDEATEHCVAIGAIAPVDPDQDYQPLFRMAPSYPSEMLRANAQGHVDFEFTVDENGFVRNPVVIDREGGRAFEKEALAAVERFRYAPRFEDGEPVPVDGVKTRITFQIER